MIASGARPAASLAAACSAILVGRSGDLDPSPGVERIRQRRYRCQLALPAQALEITGLPMMLRPFREAAFRKRAVSALGMALVTACASAPPGGSSDRPPLGSLLLSGPTFGERALLPTVCTSGERQFFLGFDFHDEKSGLVTRLVVDPVNGPIVRVFAPAAPFDNSVVFDRPECRVFHFSVDFTAWRINRIQRLDVSLDLDCHLASGDSIVGKASDSGCL
jgi:hypothetical protein